ncbi:MAG: cell division protein FtsW [Gammaproteobacteria bacterium RIFCSPHIGHO2_12_FULL_41_20]|nr:MAG: cell division protein FtsW [Gammaproteobacteria bacterium RIFCSPHIGHO2_12_FULL_41_20]
MSSTLPFSSSMSRRVITPPSPYDRFFVVAAVCIVVFGLVMMASASIVISERMWHQPFYYLYRQSAFLMIGILVSGFIIQIDTSFWEKLGGLLLVGVILLLALVLIPGIGRTVNGSTRWIGFGVVGLQVSEAAKFVVVIYMAGYLVRRKEEIRHQFSGFLKPMLILTVISILLLREPDFGAMVVIMATALGMMFLAGMSLRHFLVLFIVIALALSLIAISAPYRLLRLTSFLNPWANPFDSGYQLTQSLIAFGRSGWFGLGLGNSIQKLSYLPEAHTDFLFAIIAEEMGLIGVLIVIGLYALLVLRIFIIGRQAQLVHNHFSGLLAYGLGLWLSIQFIVSIGVNTGLLPTKGLTLPLMSYGGSSVIVNCVVLALILRIDHENRFRSRVC